MRVSLYAEGVTEPLVPFVVSRTARRPSTVPCCTRWIGFLNDLFYGRSYIAAPAKLSIPVLLDEKSAVVPVRLAESSRQSGPALRPGSDAAPGSALPNERSMFPIGRYPTKDVARHRHPAGGRERHVSVHQRLAGRRELAEETEPDLDRLLGLLVEAVVPVRAVEPGREHGVAAEHQPVAARLQADHAVPGGVAAGATDEHPRCHLVFLLERLQPAVVLGQEALGD